MTNQKTSVRSETQLPKAHVKRRGQFSLVWLAPLLAAGFVGWLLYRTIAEHGPNITLLFKDARGVEVGRTMLRYRGVRIGDVTSSKLSRDRQYVIVQVKLDRSAESIARDGSEFWIVHPEIKAGEIRGLRTLVAGDYIQVNPGNGPSRTEFTGLEEPPILPETEPGLKLLLLSTDLKAIRAGSPVFYRGIQVGQVLDYVLGERAQTVEIHIYIQPEYAVLVRQNSRFWNAGGVNISLSLFGFDISAQSAQTLVTGGIAFATPNDLEQEAPAGTTFRLYETPEPPWLEWTPAIKIQARPKRGRERNQANPLLSP